MKWYILGTYCIILIINLVYKQRSKSGSFITKMLLVPLLLMYYLSREHTPEILVILALTSGFLGDLFMEFSRKDSFFYWGVISFFTGHIFYGLCFIQDMPSPPQVPWWLCFCVIIYAIYGITFRSKLGIKDITKRNVVSAYCGVILSMSLLALLRAANVLGFMAWITFIGTILFVVSDSILAFTRLRGKIRKSGEWVMASYGLAQLFIILGL